MKLIDIHTHVFPPEVIKEREKICKKDPNFSKIYSKKSAKMADHNGLVEYMDSQGIGCVGVFSFPFKDKGLLRMCNDYVLSLRNENFFPFVMVDLCDEKWSEKEMARCFLGGAKGVGEISFYAGEFGKKEFEKLEPIANHIRRIGGILALHVNEQVGHTYDGKIRVDFTSLYNFVKRNPDLKIILCHLGGGLCFYEFMPEVKEAFQNVYYDTAALPYIYVPKIYSFLENYLSDKILFGSDFPLLSYSRYKEGLSSMSLEVRELILWRNAEKLLGLK